MTEISFTATPTCAKFMKSEAQFRLIAGPVGSGKTTACIFELLRRAMEQEPGKDGFRRTHFAVVRQTLQQLKTTVLNDIQTWLGALGEWKVSESTFYLSFGDVRSKWFLLPLEEPEDQKRLLSMQLSGAWMSEATEIDVGLVGPLMGRCGRYPVPCTWSGVIADTNMPVDGSDWHKLMELEVPSNWDVLRQPGGMEPEAENLNWLYQTAATIALPIDHPDRLDRGRQYYRNLLSGTSDDYQQRYVHAQYGNDPSGSAVFKATFNRKRHVVNSGLMPVPGHPIIVAQDFGRNPCALICQVDHRGRLLIFQEVVSVDMGLEKHVAENLRPTLMSDRFMGRACYVVGDPAGAAKGNIFEETSFDYLKRAGFRAFPAPTNQLDKRLRAVEAYLLSMRGDSAAVLIDAAGCPKLIRALEGQYRYKKLKSGQNAPLPEKSNPWSDLADALQYACLVAHGGFSNYVAEKIMAPRRAPAPAFSSAAWT